MTLSAMVLHRIALMCCLKNYPLQQSPVAAVAFCIASAFELQTCQIFQRAEAAKPGNIEA